MALVALQKSGDKNADSNEHNQPRHSNAPQTYSKTAGHQILRETKDSAFTDEGDIIQTLT
jgi:hypothetical protein